MGMRIGMEMMLTGDSVSGKEAAELGWATRSYPPEQLEGKVLEMAVRISKMPADLVQLNKRLVHRQMEIMGFRTALRAGTELCALGTHQKSMHEFLKKIREGGLTSALSDRDQPFGDYRTSEGTDTR
jgi:enoyl-CoA hydratase